MPTNLPIELVEALLKYNFYEILSVLDNPCNKAVRLFTMDVSKALDNVNHHLLTEKLKGSPFLSDRKQRLVYSGKVSNWMIVSKG